MYDFCLGIPYAAILALGGVAGFASKGSTASLASGLGAAAILAACSAISLAALKDRRLCRPATFVSLLVSGALTFVMAARYRRTGALMPAGLVAVISAGMTLFYVWNLLLFSPDLSGARKQR